MQRYDKATSLTLIGLGAAVAVFGAALFYQYVLDMPPCKLCIWQRIPYPIGAGAALLALQAGTGRDNAAARQGMLGLAALSFIVVFGLALYHVGVEQKFWPGPQGCSGGGALQVGDLRAQLSSAGKVPQCDKPAYGPLGISLAMWNAIASLLIAGAFIRALLIARREAET